MSADLARSAQACSPITPQTTAQSRGAIEVRRAEEQQRRSTGRASHATLACSDHSHDPDSTHDPGTSRQEGSTGVYTSLAGSGLTGSELRSSEFDLGYALTAVLTSVLCLVALLCSILCIPRVLTAALFAVLASVLLVCLLLCCHFCALSLWSLSHCALLLCSLPLTVLSHCALLMCLLLSCHSCVLSLLFSHCALAIFSLAVLSHCALSRLDQRLTNKGKTWFAHRPQIPVTFFVHTSLTTNFVVATTKFQS
jgi:hypothetical protein